ncbi:SRPBCC family protein [Nocardia sp. NPDC049526]|uniref:SRPBCC family protein n=1 Tax=Nocardia sp. NPDC049526 TaxID=3364316 RepID=UPI0037A671E8
MSNLEVETSITTAVDAASVLRALAALERLPEWSSVHRKVVVDEVDDQDRPLRAHAEVSLFGRTDHHEYVYEWGDDEMRWDTTRSAHLAQQRGSYLVCPDPAGTRVIFRYYIQPRLPVPGFMVRVVQRLAVESISKGLAGYLDKYSTELRS